MLLITVKDWPSKAWRSRGLIVTVAGNIVVMSNLWWLLFDRVNHDRLMAAVAARWCPIGGCSGLIRSFLTAGVLHDGLLRSKR